MLISLKKPNKQTQKTATKQIKTAPTYNNPCLHHRWRCYQAIAQNDQQVGPTSLALLSPGVRKFKYWQYCLTLKRLGEASFTLLLWFSKKSVF